MNKTPNEFAQDIWASKVKTLLHDTNIPLKQIMFQFGFLLSSSFTMAFHRATGQTPALYRRSSSQRAVVAMRQVSTCNNDRAQWKMIRESQQQSATMG
jgi:transcriptional regulator GlxA family with amidase domain